MLDGVTSQLLAVIVLPLVAGLICMFVAAIMHVPSCSRETLRQGPERVLCSSFKLLTLADAFDTDRAVLWESQISALCLIRTGIHVSQLGESWDRCVRRYPELYEGSTVTAWLEFLRDSDLVEVSASAVRLTAQGREFLALLQRNSESHHPRASSHRAIR
jgi:hypothetical protein